MLSMLIKLTVNDIDIVNFINNDFNDLSEPENIINSIFDLQENIIYKFSDLSGNIINKNI